MPRVIGEIEIYTEAEGLVISGKATDTTIPTTAGFFAPGCTLLGTDGNTYRNTGTTAVPVWDNADSISTTEIASSAITLAKLATGVASSHLVKFFKLGSTITTTALVGLAVNDIVVSVLVDGTVTVALCAAPDTLPSDPADTTYVIVFRAAA